MCQDQLAVLIKCQRSGHWWCAGRGLGSQHRGGRFKPHPDQYQAFFLQTFVRPISPGADSAPPYIMRRCFTTSFRGDVKSSVQVIWPRAIPGPC